MKKPDLTSLKGFKVLVVEDDLDLRETVSDAFVVAGAEVDIACSGKEAILLVNTRRYDFILSDMRMPNGDGHFLAAEILKLIGPKPLVFLYSGFSDITVNELTKLEIAGTFAKPFLVSEMMSSILTKFKDINRA